MDSPETKPPPRSTKSGGRDEQAEGATLDADYSTSEKQVYPLDHTDGYFVAPRSIQKFEPLMQDGNLCRLWLLIQTRVRHESGWARGNKGNVFLERGQCILGIREVAEVIGVSKNTSHKGLKELERLGLIVRDAGRLGSVVSVPNYGSYGGIGDKPGTQSGTTPGTQSGTTPGRRVGQPLGRTVGSNERLNGKRLNGKRLTVNPCPPCGESDGKIQKFDFESVYKRYPRREGKAKGLQLGKSQIRSQASFDKLSASVDEMARLWSGVDPKDEQRQFIPLFSSWMSKRRWQDETQIGPRLQSSDVRVGHYQHTGDEDYGDGEIEL